MSYGLGEELRYGTVSLHSVHDTKAYSHLPLTSNDAKNKSKSCNSMLRDCYRFPPILLRLGISADPLEELKPLAFQGFIRCKLKLNRSHVDSRAYDEWRDLVGS
jgi:hypothetical protein